MIYWLDLMTCLLLLCTPSNFLKAFLCLYMVHSMGSALPVPVTRRVNSLLIFFNLLVEHLKWWTDCALRFFFVVSILLKSKRKKKSIKKKKKKTEKDKRRKNKNKIKERNLKAKSNSELICVNILTHIIIDS